MPNVIGMDRELASETLQPLGVQVNLPEEFRCGATPGLAWDQEPDAGTPLAPNVPVRVILAPPVSTVAVPNLLEHPQEEIAASLAKGRLCAGEQTSQTGDGVGGHVMAMSPAPGARVLSGTRVNVTVRIATLNPSPSAPPPATLQTVQPSTVQPAATPTRRAPAAPPRTTPAEAAKPTTPTTPPPPATAGPTATIVPPLPTPPATITPPPSPTPAIAQPPATTTTPGWPLVAVGALTLMGLLALLVRSARRTRHGLPKQVRLESRTNSLRTSVESRKGPIVQGDVELRPIRSAAKQMLQMSGSLIRHEEKLS